MEAAGPGKRQPEFPASRVPRVTRAGCSILQEHTDTLPSGNPELEALDRALASCAIETAVTRHAGTIEEAYTLMGLTYVQTGKDLTQTQAPGGHRRQPHSHPATPQKSPLTPYMILRSPCPCGRKKAQVLVDRQYILAAMGLLSASHPSLRFANHEKGAER